MRLRRPRTMDADEIYTELFEIVIEHLTGFEEVPLDQWKRAQALTFELRQRERAQLHDRRCVCEGCFEAPEG